MSIEVKNVSRFYGLHRALDDVSFRIDEGEVVALLGPNGAGKTTMMKIITCFLPQHAGNVFVCGMNVADDPIAVKKRLGYLPEHNPLYHDMYVREYLEFVARLHRLGQLARKRVPEMIERTGLLGEHKKKIGALSKGYRQRVGLAQALIHNPDVLILDEPTSGLDPNQLVEIRQLIKEIGKEKTVLLSTHIMQEVEAICNRVVIIHKGKIAANATTSEIKRITKGGKTVRVCFDRKVDASAMMAIQGIQHAVEEAGNTFRIETLDENDIRPSLFHFAVASGAVILEMEQERRTLEDVFRQLTI